jgi:UDP-2,3-diacylglucosamine hydrolase
VINPSPSLHPSPQDPLFTKAQHLLYSYITPWQGLSNRIVLVAGEGKLPLLALQEAQAMGYEVVVLSLQMGFTLPSWTKQAKAAHIVRVGQTLKLFEYMKQYQASKVYFAGKVNKWLLFTGLNMDAMTFKLLRLTPLKNDDSIMRFSIGLLEALGLSILPQVDFMQPLFQPEGCIAAPWLMEAHHWHDACFGFDLAKASGGLDVGQTVVVSDTMAIAVEAIEGTDACLKRAGKLTRKRGGCVAKVAKPGQDTRFDVPAVGLRTLKRMKTEGLNLLITEAGRTLFLDELNEMRAYATRHGINIFSCSSAGLNPWRESLKSAGGGLNTASIYTFDDEAPTL